MIRLLLAAALLGAAPQERDATRSRQLVYQALDRLADFDDDSALVLFRAARDADLSSIVAHYNYVHKAIGRLPRAMSRLRAEYDSLPEVPEVACFRAYLAVSNENLPAAYPGLAALDESGRGGSCTPALLSRVVADMKPAGAWDARRLEYLERALQGVPDLEDVQASLASTLAALGRPDEAEAVLRRGIADPAAHPVKRLRHDMRLVDLMRRRGDTTGSNALWTAVKIAMERDGRPGLRLIYLRELDRLIPIDNVPGNPFDEVWRAQAELAKHYGAWEWEWSARYSLAMRLTDRGEPLPALDHYARLIAIADSTGNPRYQVRAYYKRGRALRSLGRLEQAEHDLTRAVEFGKHAESDYFLAEAYHNLFHFYDDSGRYEEAAAFVDLFVETVQSLRHSPLRMTAWLDAGEFNWKSGMHAASSEAFRRAVEVVDAYDEYHNYAGAYFERVGDLESARRYYRKGLRATGGSATGVRSASLAGLTRVFLAMGQLDSAEVVAREHDALIVGGADTPLLPEIMMRQGRPGDAVRLAEDWVEHRLIGGAARSRCSANLFLAELLLRAGQPARAATALDHADSLARELDLVNEAIQTKRLQGLALAAIGDTASATRLLSLAAREALNRPTDAGLRETHVALADLMAAVGDLEGALHAYEVAAAQVETATASFGLDFDRVRYRDQSLKPYDGAIRALLAAPDGSVRNRELLRWSSRRKAAALFLGTAGFNEAANLADTSTVWSRLADGRVFLDYLASGETLAAIVVTRDGLFVEQLPLKADSVLRMASLLHDRLSAVSNGRIDLARLRFEPSVAYELYRGLWQPLIPVLDGATRITISPDGPLHQVPFTALVTERPAGGSAPRFLLDHYEIEYVPSASWLSPASPVAPAARAEKLRILAVAYEAPEADEEVSNLPEAWPEAEVEVIDSAEASESNVRFRADHADIIHLATHAVASDADPLASFISLRRSATSDGLYHLAEIAGDKRDPWLVVLSGCETQVGQLYRGEGLMSLTRAFLGSGAHAVVATQWPVGPATVPLMTEFYRGLARGEDPGAALREAQLSLRTDPRTAHPFYWGGFVLHRRD